MASVSNDDGFVSGERNGIAFIVLDLDDSLVKCGINVVPYIVNQGDDEVSLIEMLCDVFPVWYEIRDEEIVVRLSELYKRVWSAGFSGTSSSRGVR